MAEHQQEQQPQQQQPQNLTAPFPTPPPFYQHFTKQNLARLRQLRKETPKPSQTSTSEPKDSQEEEEEEEEEEEGEAKKPNLDILTLPPELRYLIPPLPPRNATEKYTSFGATLSLRAPDPTLAESSIEQLYPSHPHVKLNPQPHLIALARSLLTTFLALVGTLSRNPALYEEKVEALQTIMFNMHDLINQYRPHQARETLILMMEERVEGLREEVRRIEVGRVRVGEVLRGLGVGGEEVVEGSGGGGQAAKRGRDGMGRETEEGRWTARQRVAWAALEREMERSGD